MYYIKFIIIKIKKNLFSLLYFYCKYHLNTDYRKRYFPFQIKLKVVKPDDFIFTSCYLSGIADK